MLKCDVIKDLLPLYHDKVVSEESCRLIEKHIENCLDCKTFLEDLQKDDITTCINVDCAEIGAFKKMKRKLRSKTFLISVASVLATLTLIYGVFFHTMAIPFNRERISIDVGYDTVVNINFAGGYTGAAARAHGDALFIGYYGTLFNQLFSPRDPLVFSVGSTIAVDFGRSSTMVPINEQINRIYYLDFRTIRTDTTDLSVTRIERAVLIWERQN